MHTTTNRRLRALGARYSLATFGVAILGIALYLSIGPIAMPGDPINRNDLLGVIASTVLILSIYGVLVALLRDSVRRMRPSNIRAAMRSWPIATAQGTALGAAFATIAAAVILTAPAS